MAEHGEEGCEDAVFDFVRKFHAVCEALGEPMADVALSWVLQQEGVTSALVGSRNPSELERNVPSAELKLPPDVLERLDEISGPVKAHIGENPDMWKAPSRMR